MNTSGCAFYNLFLQETEPEQRFFNHAISRLEHSRVDLAGFRLAESIQDAIELRPVQIIARMVKILEKLDQKTPPVNLIIGFFENIVKPFIVVQNNPFPPDRRVQLLASALPLITKHQTTYLREVATLILDTKNIFEQLLSSHEHAPVIQTWLNSKQHRQLLGPDLVERLTKRALHLCKSCSEDHGIGSVFKEWKDLEKLLRFVDGLIKSTETQQAMSNSNLSENIAPFSKMRALDKDEKKSNATRQEIKKAYSLPPFFKSGLQKLNISPPQGSNSVLNTKRELESRVPRFLCEAIGSFPCRPCSEKMGGENPIVPVPKERRANHTIPSIEEQINLFGERVGVWKILLSEMAMRKIKKVIDSGAFKKLQDRLQDLAHGHWRKRLPVPFGSDKSKAPLIPIWYMSANKDFIILWQIDVGYYDELTERKQYGQTIKVWNIVSPQEIRAAVDRIINGQQHISEDSVNVCKEAPIELPDGTFMPQRWECLPAYNSTIRYKKGMKGTECPTELTGKFTNVTESLIKSLSHAKGYEEFPFDLSQEELSIVNQSQTSSFILGRSGTGKTTCLLFKLFGKYQAREANPNCDRIKQLLLTKSPHLAAKLQNYARNLIDTGSGHVTAWTPQSQEPNEILKLEHGNYPFVCTYDKFLHIVENSMKNADRQKFVNDHHTKSKDKSQTVPVHDTPIIDFNTFKYEYWGIISASAPPGCPPELMFAEIMGVIRGSRICAKSLRSLHRDEYVPSGSKVSPGFQNVADREKAFDAYERYERLKKQRGQFDNLDRVMDVLKYIAKNENFATRLRECFEEIYVDEIQDLRCIDIVLLFKAVFNARGIHLAGDTAQCISKDSVFRFSEIRAAFFEEHSATADLLKQNIAKPGQFLLAKNYQSHQGILRFASWVMQVLWNGFPDTIDKLSPEIGQFDGPAPIIFASFDCSVLSSKMIGVVKMDDKVANFGAEQVILVRDDDNKAKLQQEIGDIALVLTILESKGMEFDDVLIYDFFGGSSLGSSYRCLHLLTQSQVQDFDTKKHAGLCGELKQLYVAVTRARNQLWFMETNESSVDPLAKALTTNKSLDIIDIARYKDAETTEKLKALRAGGSVDPEQWKKRAMQLFDQMNYQAAIFCYNKAGDSENADRAEGFHLRREGRSLKFTNGEGSTLCFEQAIKLFRGINMLEDAADCYEQIGKYEEAAGIWRDKSQTVRAANLFEMGKCYKDAAKCWEAGGNFEKAVETLRQGSEFDELIVYLDGNPEKLDITVRQKYSRLCNILLKQGRISSNLRAATINLLGSEEEKIEFFKEFDLINELVTYYTNNGKWIELYELYVSSGRVPDLIETVIKYKLLDLVDAKIFKEVLNFYILGVTWRRSGIIAMSAESNDAMKRLSHAFPDSWVPRHISQWISVFDLLERTVEDRQNAQSVTSPASTSLTAIFPEDQCVRGIASLLFVGFQAERHMEVSKCEYLPMIFLEKCAHIIQELENEEELLAALRVVCGIYQIERYGGPIIRHFWSEHCQFISDKAEDDSLEDLMAQAIEWAKEKLSQAVSLLDARARILIKCHFPSRCLYFLIRGFCKKDKTGECFRDHEHPTAEICGQKIASLLQMTEFYGRLTNFYYRRCMPDSFQQPFAGRRRHWIASLEEEVTFVSALEHSPRDIRMLQTQLVSNPVWKCAAACWEDHLLYRMKRYWLDIQTFTGILEQVQLAFLLGRGTGNIFGRALMRKINCILSRSSYPGHPLNATKKALIALERIYAVAPRVRDGPAKEELKSALIEFLEASKTASNNVIWNTYPFLNVIEFGTTAFLYAMNPGNAVVLPTSWAYAYLPSIILAPIPLNAAEPSEKDRNSCVAFITDVLTLFCRIFEIMERETNYARPPPTQSKPSRHTLITALGLHKRRVFNLLLTVIFNFSHYPKRPEGIDKLSARISKTLMAVAPFNWTTSVLQGPAKLREAARTVFGYYKGKNNLRVVTLDDRSTAPIYFSPFVNRENPILKVSECIGKGDLRIAQDFESLPPVFVESFQADEYSEEETKNAIILQKRWRLVWEILEGRREMEQTVEGRVNIKLHNMCNELLPTEKGGNWTEAKTIDIQIRYVLFTRGHELVVQQQNFVDMLARMKTKLKQLFKNKELPPTDLERLDEIREELWSLTKKSETASLDLTLDSTRTIVSSAGPAGLEQFIEDSLERMTELDHAASTIQANLDYVFTE